MKEYHCFLLHAVEFDEFTNYLAIFSEEDSSISSNNADITENSIVTTCQQAHKLLVTWIFGQKLFL